MSVIENKKKKEKEKDNERMKEISTLIGLKQVICRLPASLTPWQSRNNAVERADRQ